MIPNFFRIISALRTIYSDRKKNIFFSNAFNNYLKNTLQIKTVIDCGAHNGMTALEYNSILPDATIYCFEPQKNIYEKLQENISKKNTNIKAFNVALGDKIKSNVKINISSYSPSSSLLDLSDSLKKIHPHTAGVTEDITEMITLDSFASSIRFEKNILLKMDVQGYEANVLNGAKNILNDISFIKAEVNFIELYEKQCYFEDIFDIIRPYGFTFRGLSEIGRKNRENGLSMYADAIFIKN